MSLSFAMSVRTMSSAEGVSLKAKAPLIALDIIFRVLRLRV